MTKTIGLGLKKMAGSMETDSSTALQRDAPQAARPLSYDVGLLSI